MLLLLLPPPPPLPSGSSATATATAPTTTTALAASSAAFASAHLHHAAATLLLPPGQLPRGQRRAVALGAMLQLLYTFAFGAAAGALKNDFVFFPCFFSPCCSCLFSLFCFVSDIQLVTAQTIFLSLY